MTVSWLSQRWHADLNVKTTAIRQYAPTRPSSGSILLGSLSASDSTPEDIGNRGAAIVDKNKIFTIGRATYSLGECNYVGAILTDTEHGGRFNRVAGTEFDSGFSCIRAELMHGTSDFPWIT